MAKCTNARIDMNRLSEIDINDRPLIVSFGGMKGGVGRSTICAEVARSLARHGKRVLCVDANWECPTFHNLVHGEEQPTQHENWQPIDSPGAHAADYISNTAVKNIFLMSLATLRKRPFSRAKFNIWEMVEQWTELDFDYIFIDLPPTLDEVAISLFVLSDIPILVISPEPAAIRSAIQTGRAALLQSFGLHQDADENYESLIELSRTQPLTMNREQLIRNAANSETRRLINETCDNLELYVITNFVREGSERDLGFVVSHAMFQEIGVYPRTLGAIDHEDRRWFFNRQTTGQPARGEEALSDDIESIARSIRNIEAFDVEYPRPVSRGNETAPAHRIGMRSEVSRNDLRQHCRILWEGYRREVSIKLMFSNPKSRLEIADRLEGIYRGILTLSHDHPPKKKAVETTEKHDPLAKNQDSNSSTDTERSPAGREIERLRRSQKMSLRDLSHRTHIGIKFLSAIEDGNAPELPRPVYLRGYLREIARVLDVDQEDLIDEYFSFLDFS